MEKSERCISLKSVWGDVFRGCWWIRWWRLGMPSMGPTKGPGGRHPPKPLSELSIESWKKNQNTSGWKSKMEVRWGKAGGIHTGTEWKRQLCGCVPQFALTVITNTSSTAQVHASVTVKSNWFQCVLAIAGSLGSTCLPHSGIWTKAEPTSGTHYGHSRSRRGELGACDGS